MAFSYCYSDAANGLADKNKNQQSEYSVSIICIILILNIISDLFIYYFLIVYTIFFLKMIKQ